MAKIKTTPAAAAATCWTLTVKTGTEVRRIKFVPGCTYRSVKPKIYDELLAKGVILDAFAQK